MDQLDILVRWLEERLRSREEDHKRVESMAQADGVRPFFMYKDKATELACVLAEIAELKEEGNDDRTAPNP